jgi:hypothetical protein
MSQCQSVSKTPRRATVARVFVNAGSVSDIDRHQPAYAGHLREERFFGVRADGRCRYLMSDSGTNR